MRMSQKENICRLFLVALHFCCLSDCKSADSTEWPYAGYGVEKGKIYMATPVPVGIYNKTPTGWNAASSGSIVVTRLPAPYDVPNYDFKGYVSFEVVQNNEDPSGYPKASRCWGGILVNGVYAAAMNNFYLNCKVVIHCEATGPGTFDMLEGAGVSRGSRKFSIMTNEAICTVLPDATPPKLVIIFYKNATNIPTCAAALVLTNDAQEASEADSLNEQVIDLYKAGNYQKAIPIARQVLKIREKISGPDHPEYATSLNNLAVLYEEMGDYTNAEPLYGRALEIRERPDRCASARWRFTKKRSAQSIPRPRSA